MLFEQWGDLVGRVRYKTGWKLEVLPGEGDSILRVSVLTQDADGTGLPITVIFKYILPDVSGSEEAIRAICQTLAQVEMHEVAEFFLVSGVRVYDPHEILDLSAMYARLDGEIQRVA